MNKKSRQQFQPVPALLHSALNTYTYATLLPSFPPLFPPSQTMINNKSSQRQLTKLTRENGENSQKYLANTVKEGAGKVAGEGEEEEAGAAAVAVTVTATFTAREHVVVLVAQNELEIVEPAEMANKQNCISQGKKGRRGIQ